MKFGKLLKNWAAEERPENSELVLRFKDLKKQLKLVKPAEQGGRQVTERIRQVFRIAEMLGH